VAVSGSGQLDTNLSAMRFELIDQRLNFIASEIRVVEGLRVSWFRLQGSSVRQYWVWGAAGPLGPGIAGRFRVGEASED